MQREGAGGWGEEGEGEGKILKATFSCGKRFALARFPSSLGWVAAAPAAVKGMGEAPPVNYICVLISGHL